MGGKFNKGNFFIMSEGEYDYYGVFGLFRALVDLDIKELAATYKDSLVDTEWDYHDEEFPRWLIENGYVESIECDELHIGNYHDFDPVKWCEFERMPDDDEEDKLLKKEAERMAWERLFGSRKAPSEK